MNSGAVEITEILRKFEERLPDDHFEGMLHEIGFDWSMFKSDFNLFLEKFRELSAVIGKSLFNALSVQLIWRVPEGAAAEESFLRALFGEVPT
ncbi:hypothetical protein [Paenibacillus sp. NPDC058177]|uniref:hypothetical protein n=1 Tax=Paenibacillus sp. NPDC058177 TaxID=3346369 RepID=UPI0036DE7EC9